MQAPPRPPRTRVGRLRAGDAPAGRRPEPRPTALGGPRSYLRPLPPPRPRRGMRHDDPGARSGARPQPAAAARAEDEGGGGSPTPPRRPPSLPALRRGSLRLPVRLTGLAPAFRPLSGQSCRRPTGPAAAASRALLPFLPGSSGFPSPPRVAWRKPARRWASSPLPRRDQWAPAAGKPRPPPGGGGPSGHPAGGGKGRRATGGVGPPAPARRCAVCPCHVGAAAAAVGGG